MAQISQFSAAAALASRSLRRSKRDIADKLNEIRLRSPKDIAALDVMMELVLKRLDAEDQPPRH